MSVKAPGSYELDVEQIPGCMHADERSYQGSSALLGSRQNCDDTVNEHSRLCATVNRQRYIVLI